MTDPFHKTDHSSLIFYFYECSGEQSSEFSPAPQYTMPNKKTEGEAMIIS